MSFTIAVGIVGTLVAMAMIVNAIRLGRSGKTGVSAFAQIQILMALIFIPLVWYMILVLLPGEGGGT